MKCPLCKGTMKKGCTSLPCELDHDRVLVVRDVPGMICDQCGETFIEMAITKRVEKMVSVAEKDGLTLGFIDYQRAA